jgi:transcriptional regulator with XRE-family HTH domain
VSGWSDRPGTILYKVRLALGVPLGYVAEVSGYSASLISAIESGSRSLSPDVETILVNTYDKILRQCLAAGREVGLARPAETPGKGRRRRAA